MKTGKKTNPSSCSSTRAYMKKNNIGFITLGKILTLNSKAATPIPDAAPVPAKPMKCSLPILLANSDAPTGSQNMYFPARKYPSMVSRFGRIID